MSINAKVKKIQSLKLSINREVWKRDEALLKHGEENDKFFEALKKFFADIQGFFEARAGRKAVYLHKRLADAKAAQAQVSPRKCTSCSKIDILSTKDKCKGCDK